MKKWLPLMVGAGVLMGASAYWWHTRPYNAAQLMQCLPAERSLHVYLDVGMLRAGGILDLVAGAKGTEDADYKKFVEESGFDYRSDMDAVAAGFRDGDQYFAVKGRFHWDKLANYARNHGGRCQDLFCSMAASDPSRTISFTLLRADVLALAVARDPRAVDLISPGEWKTPPTISAVALWIDAPPFVFSDPAILPTGTRSFLSPLAQARGTIFTLGPTADRKAFQLMMDVDSATPEDAAKLAGQLASTTDLLKKMLERDNKKPSSSDLSGVLVAGRFEAQQSRVTGTWAIERSFLESLVSGKVE